MSRHFDEYQAQREFNEANPEPERPRLPQAGQRTTPQVVMHRDGGVWLQVYAEDEPYTPQSAYPAIELCLTHNEKALKVRITAEQFQVLLDSAAAMQTALASRVAQIETWRDQLAEYEQQVKDRTKRRDAYVKAEEKAFNERQRREQQGQPRAKRG
ncbi:MAG: hypothetical protein DPW16_12380 [Chloroflexi bacterium]|nr:hypothetical protein [Chloroflexota bacterium]